MQTIWKYPLHKMINYIELPTVARVLAVHMQGRFPCLWVQLDTHSETMRRKFAIYSTGEELPDNAGIYVGSVFPDDAELVWHIYEI